MGLRVEGPPRTFQFGSSPLGAMAASSWTWCCATGAVQELWQKEGVEGPADLVTLYASTAELLSHLRGHGLSEADVNSGALALRDAPRALSSSLRRASAPTSSVARSPPREVLAAPKKETRARKRRGPRARRPEDGRGSTFGDVPGLEAFVGSWLNRRPPGVACTINTPPRKRRR